MMANVPTVLAFTMSRISSHRPESLREVYIPKAEKTRCHTRSMQEKITKFPIFTRMERNSSNPTHPCASEAATVPSAKATTISAKSNSFRVFSKTCRRSVPTWRTSQNLACSLRNVGGSAHSNRVRWRLIEEWRSHRWTVLRNHYRAALLLRFRDYKLLDRIDALEIFGIDFLVADSYSEVFLEKRH